MDVDGSGHDLFQGNTVAHDAELASGQWQCVEVRGIANVLEKPAASIIRVED
jgi:hypothetical protein